jgi:arylsulfatase A-like enzyme
VQHPQNLVRIFRGTLCLTLALIAFEAAASSRPNIVFIFSDDHAVNAIGAYGSRINQTPNIDRIAREGTILLNNMCGNSICGPSRATILTGLHSHANGFMKNGDEFNGAQRTFPKLLQQGGYETAVIGKWHLKSEPTGFDYWDVLPGQGSYYNPAFKSAEGRRQIFGYNTDIVTDLSIRWMQEERDSEKPFLLMCQFKAPHRNWMPNIKHLNQYDGEQIPEPATLLDNFEGRTSSIRKNSMMIGRHMRLMGDLQLDHPNPNNQYDVDSRKKYTYSRLSPEQRRQWDEAFAPENAAFYEANLEGDDLVRWKYQRYIKNYLRCITSVDENVGRILDYLDWAGLAENTIVIYSSDQGFYLGEHGFFDKRWMYEESVRMPFIARWPGVIPAGGKVSEITQNIDFAPTFLEIAGLTPPDDMHGRSALSLLRGESVPDWRDSIYYHYYEEGGHGVARHEGVRTDRYKLIHFYDVDEWEFYDLEQDPNEMLSRYGDPEYAARVERLREELSSLKSGYAVP